MGADSLGDRMKANYEDRCRHYLTRRTPVIIRLDGKAFHTFTRGMEKPFSEGLADAMEYAAGSLAIAMQGCKMAYLQSDEASFLLTDYDRIETDAWFDYGQSKMESVAASHFTAAFNSQCVSTRLAMFDARSFNIPREEVANYFLWRAKDWERNSVSMYAQAFFSAKQLHGQGRADQHEMLHSIGKNWATDLSDRWRNGTWIVRVEGGFSVSHKITPTYQDIAAIVDPLI